MIKFFGCIYNYNTLNNASNLNENTESSSSPHWIQWRVNLKKWIKWYSWAKQGRIFTIPALDFQNKQSLIQSDSLSALTSIQNKFSTNPIVNHIYHQLLILTTLNFDIKLMYIYIPSHVGILGNNEIDHHAKSATSFSTVNFLSIQYLKNSSFKLNFQYGRTFGLHKLKTNSTNIKNP